MRYRMRVDSPPTGDWMVNIVHWREYIARGAAIAASEKAAAAERHDNFWRPPAYRSEFRKVTRTNNTILLNRFHRYSDFGPLSRQSNII